MAGGKGIHVQSLAWKVPSTGWGNQLDKLGFLGAWKPHLPDSLRHNPDELYSIYMFGMSFGHLLILCFILLLLFGAKKLPELGSALGKGLRAFKDGMDGKTQVEDKTNNDDTKNPKA